jgi:hypothetical protein
LPARGALDELGDVLVRLAIGGEEPAEDAHRRDVTRDRRRRQAPDGAQAGEVLDDRARAQLIGPGDAVARQVVEQVAQVAGVGLEGVVGQAALHAEEGHEPIAGVLERRRGHARRSVIGLRGRRA